MVAARAETARFRSGIFPGERAVQGLRPVLQMGQTGGGILYGLMSLCARVQQHGRFETSDVLQHYRLLSRFTPINGAFTSLKAA